MFIVNNDFLEKGILSRLKKKINWFVKYARGRSSFAKLQEFARGWGNYNRYEVWKSYEGSSFVDRG